MKLGLNPRAVLFFAALPLFACGSSDATTSGTGGSSSVSSTSSSTSTSTSSSTSTSTSSSSSGGQSLGAEVSNDTTLSGDVDMPMTTVVKAGVTLTLSAGTVIHAGMAAKLQVDGTLLGNGTSASAVTIQGAANKTNGEWAGLEITATGSVTASYLTIHNAKVAFTTDNPAKFALDHLTIDTSTQALILNSDGTISHGALHGIGAGQSGDPVQVGRKHSASPTLSDIVLDNGGMQDQINVKGAGSAPVFDHLDVSQCHCAFHLDSGQGITIKNSVMHDAVYGIMNVDSIGTVITASNFEKNQNNVGTCYTGDIALDGCFFDGAPFDASCMGQTNTNAAGKANVDVGPRP